MKLCTAFLLALCATFLPVKAISVFDHVSRVNSEWNNPVFSVDAFRNQRCDDALSERRLVQLHLQSVIRLLKERSITGLSANQLQARANNIALLAGYAEAGSFPRNITHRGRIPVFVDDRNVPCAVGYLMLLAGYTDFVGETRTNVNNIYIRQIKSDVFTKFHAESGLTLDELALIQPCYGEYLKISSLPSPDFATKILATDTLRGMMYAFGVSITDATVNKLAVFNGVTWTTIPNNIKGSASCMTAANGTLYIAGDFSNGNSEPIGLVSYDGNSWQEFTANDEIRCLTVDNTKLYVGGKFTSIAGKPAKYFAEYDLQAKTWNTNSADFNAPINAITVYLGKVVVGGEFTKNGTTEHLYLSEWNGTSWKSVISPFNRPITALYSQKIIGNSSKIFEYLYAGSSRTDAADTAHHTLIAVQSDTVWKDFMDFTRSRMSIEERIQASDSLLLVTGFESIKLYGSTRVLVKVQSRSGGHLMSMYNDFLNLCGDDMLGSKRLGSSTLSAKYFQNYLYINSSYGVSRTDFEISDVDENTPLASSLTVVGQSRESVTFRLPSEPHTQVSMTLVDILGVEVSREVISTGDQLTLHTSHLSQGAYYARITADGKSYTKKLLVSY